MAEVALHRVDSVSQSAHLPTLKLTEERLTVGGLLDLRRHRLRLSAAAAITTSAPAAARPSTTAPDPRSAGDDCDLPEEVEQLRRVLTTS